MSDVVILTAVIVVHFDSKAKRKLNKSEIQDAIQDAVSSCSKIENAADVACIALTATECNSNE